MDVVNERSTLVVTASFYDENKNPVVPTAGTYRIDDADSGFEILADTDLPALAVAVDIGLTPDQMRILVATHAFETRLLTVKFAYGEAKQGTGEYRFMIRNLMGVTDPG